MARITDTQLKLIINTNLDRKTLLVFIDDASNWVDENLANLNLAASTLVSIERYLAAHFVTIRDPRLSEATLDDVKEKYVLDPKVSEYLKIAVALDPSGRVSQAFIGAGGGGSPAAAVVFRFGTTFTAEANAAESDD